MVDAGEPVLINPKDRRAEVRGKSKALCGPCQGSCRSGTGPVKYSGTSLEAHYRPFLWLGDAAWCSSHTMYHFLETTMGLLPPGAKPVVAAGGGDRSIPGASL